jgi:putative FmdB family regulatory protein
MTYQYHCNECGNTFDVIKHVAEIDIAEYCPKCKQIAVREFAPARTHLMNTKVEEAYYNPGLGCVVQNKSHLKQICKDRHLEEVGSEKPEVLHKHFDTKRKEKWEKDWAASTKGWVGNGT